jgi:hypothetical protein
MKKMNAGAMNGIQPLSKKSDKWNASGKTWINKSQFLSIGTPLTPLSPDMNEISKYLVQPYFKPGQLDVLFEVNSHGALRKKNSSLNYRSQPFSTSVTASARNKIYLFSIAV